MQATADKATPSEIYVGRQPIFDRELSVYGYELLYRESAEATQCRLDTQTAFAVVMANAVLDFGLDTLTRGAPAFINCCSSAWSDELFDLFPKDKVVLEVLEDVPVDGELERILRRAKESGYVIALDDVVSIEKYIPLLPWVDIVKLELPALSEDKLIDVVGQLKGYDVKILAEKVETQEEFERVKDLGCDYFQGFFFARPKTITGKKLPSAHLQTLQILNDLSDEDADIDEIAAKVAGDVAMSVRILRYANSAAVGCRTELTSIQRAIAMIGFNQIRKWAQVIVMSGLATNKPSELLFTALMRARFCELVASRGREAHPQAFTVGLLSLLDALLDQPLETTFAELSLSDELEAAILNGDGPLGHSLSIARAYENFDWEKIGQLAPDETEISTHLSDWFVSSMTQAQEFYSVANS